MMKFIEQIGKIKVYEERHSERDTTITFMNGSDIVASERLEMTINQYQEYNAEQIYNIWMEG